MLYITICKTNSYWKNCCITQEVQPDALGQPRGSDGWGLGGAGREAQEGEDICIFLADSQCCMAKTNTTLRAIILQLKLIFKNYLKKKIQAPHCLLQHYLQQSGHRSNLNIHQQRNG